MSLRTALAIALFTVGCSPSMLSSSRGEGTDAGVAAADDDAARPAPRPDRDAGGSSSWYVDSDGDGVADAVETYAGTDPGDASESPRTRGDFFFAVPYQADPTPPRDTLVMGTAIQRADVHFMIDTSISMQGYIDTVRDSLSGTIIPGVTEAIPDVWFGAGQFDVCPNSDWHPDTCRGISMDATSTSDAASVTSALGTLTADCAPVHEPYAQAAWLWATGDTSHFPGMTARDCPPGTVGLGCVRADALPILVVIGDEPFSESYRSDWPTTTFCDRWGGCSCGGGTCEDCLTFPQSSAIVSAFSAVHGRLVVLGPTGNSREWAPIVRATGAVDESGEPLIFPDAGTDSIDRAVVDAIARLARSTPLSVTARVVDLDDDGVDASIFVERIEPNVTGGVADPRDTTRVCVGGLSTFDDDHDGIADGFDAVPAGTDVCFDIVARRNETVPPIEEPQVFRAEVEVVGDGVTVLDTRTIYFLVSSGDAPPILI